MKNSAIILLAILALSSCRKEIEMEIPDGGRKLVINAMFNTDSILTVNLFRSKHILDEGNSETISSATVIITDQSGTQ